MKKITSVLAVLLLAALQFTGLEASAQTTAPTASPTVAKGETSNPSDSAMIFESPRPLITNQAAEDAKLTNEWGLGAFFSDYGFGGTLFYGKELSSTITALASVDFGSAKGSKEFGFGDELKVNRIFVTPIMASLQYRVLRGSLSDNLRPYVTAGVGGAVITTTPADQEFFTSFGSSYTRVQPAGFVGIGANFGSDKKNTFGANLRYFIIPYPAPGVQSTQNGPRLTDFNGLFLTATYGMYF